MRIVDDLSGRYAEGTGPAAAAALAARGADVTIAAAVPAHVDGADAVIHLAGLLGVRTRRPPSAFQASNVAVTERLVRAAAGARFVLASSSSVYGNAPRLPTPEHTPPAPLNPYAASNVAAEQVVLEHGADALIVRPFSVYGPGQRPEMAFARWIESLAAGRPAPGPRRRGVQPVRLGARDPARCPRGPGGGIRAPGLHRERAGLRGRGVSNSRLRAQGGRRARQ